MSVRCCTRAVQRGSGFVRRTPFKLGKRCCPCNQWTHGYSVQTTRWASSTSSSNNNLSETPSFLRKEVKTSEYYANAISKLFKSDDREACHRVELLLLEMEQASKTNEDVQPPSTVLYNQVISMYGQWCMGKDAERLLRHLQKKTSHAKPDSVTYNACIAAWACSREKNAAGRAEALLKELSSHQFLKPDANSFNAVISVHARHGDLQRANNVLQQMIHAATSQPDSHVKLDAITLSSVISLLAKSRKRGAAIQAVAILERMEAMYKAGDDKVKPDAITYSTVISALANSGERDAADRAMQLLKRMEELYHDKGDVGLKPDTVTFNAVLAAIANSGESDSGEKAQSLLQLMHHRHEAGNADVRPNTISYSTVMLAWKNSGDARAGDKAEALLRKLQGLYQGGEVFMEPNTVCFSTVISALAKSGTRQSAERAEKLLDEMHQLHASGLESVQPNTITYSSVMEAWAATGEADAVERLERIIQKMTDLSKSGDSVVAPNTISYNICIKAIEKCPVEGKADKAMAMFRTMQDRYRAGDSILKPSTRTYNAMFQVCAATTGSNHDKRKALKVVLLLLRELRSNDTSVKPDFYTYPAVFKACANLFEENDMAPLREAFHACCEDQMVDRMVLSHIKRAAPGYLEEQIGFRGKDVKFEDIPMRWSRRTRRKGNRRQR